MREQNPAATQAGLALTATKEGGIRQFPQRSCRRMPRHVAKEAMNGQFAHVGWFTNRFGDTSPVDYRFPFRQANAEQPVEPITDITGAWEALRKRAGVHGRCIT